MLEAKSLRKVTVPASLLPFPSPGSIQPTRLALHVSDSDSFCSAFIASGCRVYKLQIPLTDSLIHRGKESLLIPVCVEVTDSSVLNHCPHRSEIQSLVLAETDTGCLILGSVDSYGYLIISKLDISGKDVQKLTFAVSPQDCGVGEGSWAGLSFSPSQWSMAAVARSFCRSIDIYDQEIHLRSLHTLPQIGSRNEREMNLGLFGGKFHVSIMSFRLWCPSSLTFVENQFFGTESSILAITEGCQLTIWDMRMKENGGCLQRICGSPGDIFYAICTSSTGNIAVGGADRTVTIYDPRRWSAISRLVNCSKFEITGLAFSSIDNDYIYVQGVDYEVFCGHWSDGKKIFSFRGDSSWLGFHKCHDKDVLGGWCDSGSIFVADIGA